MKIRNARELGHLVRERRQLRGLTQAALAARVGVSRKWLIDLEHGKRTADLSLVLRTLNAIGLEVDAREPTSANVQRSDIDSIVDASRRGRA